MTQMSQKGGNKDERHVSSIAKVTEIVGCSTESFEDAVRQAVSEASQTIRHISGVEVLRHTAKVNEGDIMEYRVDLKIAFGVERPGHSS